MYKEKFSLEGKNIVLTGANGILGRHQVVALAEMGAHVHMLDINDDGLDEFIGTVERCGKGDVEFHKLDVTQEKDIEEFYDRLDGRGVFPDILINNAATKSEHFFEPLDNYSLEDWKYVMEVNLNGMFLASKHVLKRMIKRREGLIVNFSSIYGINGPDPRIYEGSFYMGREINTPPVYSASKAGAVGFSRYIATVYGAMNIRCNTITPGGVFSGQNPKFVEKYSARVPLGKMASPEDIACAVIFLCSDASKYINGMNLIVDGGLSAW